MKKEPIAIVGLSCRFPGVDNLEEFWQLLINGKDTINEISRWDIDQYFNPDKDAKDKTHQRHGSMFDKLDEFDPFFFNISPAEAAEMNPSQKLMMELAWECIENSSIPYNKIKGSKTGVYIGNIWSDFEHHRKHKNAEVTSHSAVGQAANIIANRISFFYGFSGPSLVVDTGCSSSLVALHLACQSLWEGSTTESIVGGINHTLDPDQNILLSKFGGLSARGKCSTFDANADGFVRGEGAGVIIIKKLCDAERDGDKIYAVIKGSAMNNNGHNINLPATSIKGQLDVLEAAYADSGIKPEEVHFVEAHGTGTQLGDPTESKALGTFFGKNRNQPLKIGSVKTNVGHLEGAAGMAGLIKAILAINNKNLPKNSNYNTPNPSIDFDNLNIEVIDKNTPWEVAENETRKAGVNSFGWGGTNAHVVIEEHPVKQALKSLKTSHSRFMLPISAQSPAALAEYVNKYKTHLETKVNGSVGEFTNMIAASAIRKPALQVRKLFSAENKSDMLQQLGQFKSTDENEAVEKPKVVFVFPGQGSQWLGMGRELFKTEKVFRDVIEKFETVLSNHCDWSLIHQLHADEDDSLLDQIDVIQPILCVMQIALAKLWLSYGIKPDALVGHSMGEVAAAHISGAISMEDAANIICTRSKLMKTVSGTGGAMAVTELTTTEAQEVIKNYSGLSVAVSNSPKSTVVAGEEQAILQLLEQLDKEDKFCKQVKVDVASHSIQMEPLMAPLGKALAGTTPKENDIRLFSTVRNQEILGYDLTSEYWVENLREGVQFTGVMKKLIEDECNIFIEVSPHPVLITAINECIEAFGGNGHTSPTCIRNKPEVDVFYQHLDEVYQSGANIDWAKYYQAQQLPFINLPGYPFQRDTYSLTERKNNIQKDKQGHIIIGQEIKLALLDNVHFWEAEINIDDFIYLKDHKVSDTVVLPGATYLEMVTAAVQQLNGEDHVAIHDLQFKTAVTLSEGESVKLQLKIHSNNHFSFYKYSNEGWVITAEGKFGHTKSLNSKVNLPRVINGNISSDSFYKQMQTLGLEYGPYFQGLREIERSHSSVKAHVEINNNFKHTLVDYTIHPAVVDACLQTLFANHSTREGQSASTYLTGVESVQVIEPIQKDSSLTVITDITESLIEQGGKLISITANINVADKDGNLLLAIKGLAGKVFVTSEEESQDNWHYSLNWAEIISNQAEHTSKSIFIMVDEFNRQSKSIETELLQEGHATTVALSNSLSNNSIEDFDIIVYFANKLLPDHDLQAGHHFIDLMQKLDKVRTKKSPQINIITRGAHAIKSNHINLGAASLLGLARVAANELSQFEMQIIDLSYKPNPAEFKSVSKIISGSVKNEREIALRDDSIFGARLETFSPNQIGLEHKTFNSERYHLITGYKGIAFTLVEWMFERGARHFCLVSRSCEIDQQLQQRIARLEDKGAKFSIEACDVVDHSSLQSLISKLVNEEGLSSIVHAAGIISARELTELSRDEYNQIMSVKALGALNLHEASKDLDLEHFILFSSASALLGLRGQGSYVSANAFLDSLAALRKRSNLPAMSINWGVMSDAGMVAKASNLERFAEAEGFIATPMSEAVAALDEVFDLMPTNVGVFRFKPEQTAEYFPVLGKSNYFMSLLEGAVNTQQKDLRKTLIVIPEREERIQLLKSHLVEITAAIIKMDVDKLSTKTKFKSLGIDSLMAVQFRNKVEKATELKLSVADIWSHPTIDDYTQFILGQIDATVDSRIEKTKSASDKINLSARDGSEYEHHLVCFHDAGGNSSLFDSWQDKISKDVQLITVELPGRSGEEIKNADISKVIHQITEKLSPQLTHNFSFFGHSMGGLVAFEVAKALQKYEMSPVQLIVSSTPQLASYDKNHLDPEADNKTLAQRFPHLSPSVTQDVDLRNMLISMLRTDLRYLSSYEYKFSPPMNMDIIAIHGKDDQTVSEDQMKRWAKETTRTFDFIQRPGDHHYLRTDTTFVTDLVNEVCHKKSSEKVTK